MAGGLRRSVLSLSKQGWTIHSRIVPFARALEAELIAALTPAEGAALDKLPAKLHARAEVLDSG